MNVTRFAPIIACLLIAVAPVTPARGQMYSLGNLNPWAARYGNWGGAGYGNGQVGGYAFGSAPAVDRLDALCRQHDRAYATADATFRPQYQRATSAWQRFLIDQQWRTAYTSANSAIIAGAAALPPLHVYADGTDSWGGRNIPWSVGNRCTFKNCIVLLVFAEPNAH